MSERLTAPARSPLRRVEGKDSPLRGKHSKSPIRRLDAKSKLRSNGSMETLSEATEADAFQAQIAEAGIDHDTSHLSPALQRFWQRSKAGVLSPRSVRLGHNLPKPKGACAAALAHLTHARGQLADMLDHTRAVQATVGSFLKRHFEIIPQCQLSAAIRDRFRAFDISGDGTLSKQELKDAFASMGKIVTDTDLDELMLVFDADQSHTIDAVRSIAPSAAIHPSASRAVPHSPPLLNQDEFEALVRTCLNIPLSPSSPADAPDAPDTVG